MKTPNPWTLRSEEVGAGQSRSLPPVSLSISSNFIGPMARTALICRSDGAVKAPASQISTGEIATIRQPPAWNRWLSIQPTVVPASAEEDRPRREPEKLWPRLTGAEGGVGWVGQPARAPTFQPLPLHMWPVEIRRTNWRERPVCRAKWLLRRTLVPLRMSTTSARKSRSFWS